MTSKPLNTESDRRRHLAEAPKPGTGEPYRTAWRIDFARLVHGPAFRRLQGKTQLFPAESDFFRNRLTHSLEVAQIAKSIAIKLNYECLSQYPNPQDSSDPDYRLNEDLVEFSALAHDLGHPPFGHQGELALDECMREHGGFEGNAQTLRILSRTEKKRTTNERSPEEFVDGIDQRRGLNVTFRSLASILKYDRKIYNRPANTPSDYVIKGYYSDEEELVKEIKKAVVGSGGIPPKFKTIECQIMDIADDIAYSTYDFEDAMKAGFTSLLDLLRLSNKKEY